MAQNYGLGRGLASLIPQKKATTPKPDKITKPDETFNYFGGDPHVSVEKSSMGREDGGMKNKVVEVDISRIVPNPHQPRIQFDQLKLQELADSIKEHGILQPIVVSRTGQDYEIIAGERRFQASKLARLMTVPVIVREVTDQQKLELAILENIQRHDLNSVEEAKAYQKLVDEFDLSQDMVAKKVGKSRSAVANKIRLLSLPIEIQRGIIEKKITEGHAKAILALENQEKQRALYEMILKNNLTVRQVEDKTKEISVKSHKRIVQVDPEMKQIEEQLSSALNTKVKLQKAGAGGKITIEYYSKEELENLVKKISFNKE